MNNIIYFKSRQKLLNEYLEKHRGVLTYHTFRNNADYDFEILEIRRNGSITINDAACVNGELLVNVRGTCFFDNLQDAIESFEYITGRLFTNDYKDFIKEKYNSIIKTL